MVIPPLPCAVVPVFARELSLLADQLLNMAVKLCRESNLNDSQCWSGIALESLLCLCCWPFVPPKNYWVPHWSTQFELSMGTSGTFCWQLWAQMPWLPPESTQSYTQGNYAFYKAPVLMGYNQEQISGFPVGFGLFLIQRDVNSQYLITANSLSLEDTWEEKGNSSSVFPKSTSSWLATRNSQKWQPPSVP